MRTDLRIERMTGAMLPEFVPDLARLRIEVFREFPYLYDGDLDYEAHYLRTYIEAPQSVVVLAFEGDTVIGASTGVPMRFETAESKRPFVGRGYDPEAIFYLGESVLRRPYRGRGIGVRFFAEREAYAREIGDFAWSAFCAVDRPADHPRRPPDYVPLDGFWEKRGYRRHPELRTEYTWRDLDEQQASPKPMTYWLKSLRAGRRDPPPE